MYNSTALKGFTEVLLRSLFAITGIVLALNTIASFNTNDSILNTAGLVLALALLVTADKIKIKP